MPYRIAFTPEVREQLDQLQTFITTAADVQIASRFVNGIIDHIAALDEFPNPWVIT